MEAIAAVASALALAIIVAIALPVVISLIGAGILGLVIWAVVMVVRVYNKMGELAGPVVKIQIEA